MRHSLIAVLTLALALGAPSLAAADEAARLVPSADGRELIDAAAGLAWSRCVEGMKWDGRRCSGEPVLATHAQALALARARSEAEGRSWRMPRVTELKRFFEHLARAQAAATLAPAAPKGWYWTGTTRIESEAVNPYSYRNVERGASQRQVDRLSVQQGWAVEQPGGAPRDMAKREQLSVRLVRPLQP
ncbi:hypothetical protein J2X20_000906 [Pelomonas saccharophila]|uniref:Lcl C-terminal domain-containing protein n=1 Tax=Roseateles saccharophilus TaxID=304 RepID=A0ABU1YHE6_ROSSA|nr:DUF1566 domain-containing protein [Roseateles saccharophilus]MDR7268277.1 hypothetical protein [Roseateles saccharophilus]